jgi:hypothetical protein
VRLLGIRDPCPAIVILHSLVLVSRVVLTFWDALRVSLVLLETWCWPNKHSNYCVPHRIRLQHIVLGAIYLADHLGVNPPIKPQPTMLHCINDDGMKPSIVVHRDLTAAS